MRTWLPLPRTCIGGRKCRARASGASRLIAICSRTRSSLVSASGASRKAPALLTIASGVPCCSDTWANAAVRARGSIRSTCRSMVCDIGGMADRDIRITRAPCLARSAAVTAPMPRDAPVTRMVCPAKGLVMSGPGVFDEVPRGFPEADTGEPAGRQPRGDLFPDVDRDILCAGKMGREPGDVEIEVAVIEVTVDVGFEERMEHAHIDHVSRLRIDLPFDA